MQQESVKEILYRTNIIDDEQESIKIIDKILKMKKPIGIDMEGHHFSRVQLVQIKTDDGKIYLLRTGMNPKIIYEGKLKRLLEDETVMKVFHAGTGDCMAVYKLGVQMVNIYDTAIAHSVIQYQNSGRSISKANSISFNNICDRYGLPVNPMKKDMQDSSTLWSRENVYQEPKLSDEMKAYSAFDVESLLDLKNITNSLIAEDYQPLLKYLCENELIRNVDPHLLKLRKKHLKEKEDCCLFIDRFVTKFKDADKGIGKMNIYEFLACHEGMKDVYFSNASAHVIMPTRQSTISLYDTLTKDRNTPGSLAKEFQQKIGENAKVCLINDAESSEILSVSMDNGESLQKLKAENYVIDLLVIRKLMDILLKVKYPVMLDFTWKDENLGMELFVGTHPVLKFRITQESVEHGIGELIASSNIVKIVARLDTDNVYQAFRMLSLLGFKPSNIFDLNTACNAIDYAVMGNSIFTAHSLPIKKFAARFGIETPTQTEDFFYLYLYLVNHLLPPSILNLISKKSVVDTDIGSNISIPESKEQKRKLRIMHESHCVHITLNNLRTASKNEEESVISLFKSLLKQILENKKITYERIDIFNINPIVRKGGFVGIIHLCYPDDIHNLIEIINAGEISTHELTKLSRSSLLQREQHSALNISFVGVPINDKNHIRVDSKSIIPANLRKLIQSTSANQQNLESLGLFAALDEYKIESQNKIETAMPDFKNSNTGK
jgi:hypothetical protein